MNPLKLLPFVALLCVPLGVSPSQAASQGFVVATCPGTLGVNAYTAGQYGAITVDVNGIQCTAASASLALPTFGAAFPATGMPIGFSQGGNLVAATGIGGSLNVNVTGGGGGGVADQTAWTNASSTFVPNGGVFNDSATALSSGNEGTVRLNANREMHVTCDANNVMCTIMQAPEPLRAQSSEQTAVANGATVPAAADLTGKTIVLPYANPENFLNGEITAAMTGTSSTALTGMGAQGGSFRVYATACTFSNSHATVGTMILLQDGSGGSTLWQAPAAPAFNGAAVVFPTPIKTTANNGLFAQNVTTGSNTFVSCTGYKGI